VGRGHLQGWRSAVSLQNGEITPKFEGGQAHHLGQLPAADKTEPRPAFR